MMIDKVDVKNFKCFESESVGLHRLNIFAGINGSGKSTIVQAILALVQSHKLKNLEFGELALNGPLVELGTGKDVLFRDSKSNNISIDLSFGDESIGFDAVVPKGETVYYLNLDDFRTAASEKIDNLKLFYISADRLGPRKLYPSGISKLDINPIGNRGEFAPFLSIEHRFHEIENKMLLLEDEQGFIFNKLESQQELWMRRMFESFRQNITELPEVDAISVGYTLNKQIGEHDFFRPSNIGFGVSVVFPIIVAGLLATKDTVLIVENPEAHLHPSAQSLMGEFLARVAFGGAQVLVETHSDHVINGIKIAVLQTDADPKLPKFYAFSRNSEAGRHSIDRITLNASGDFESQPNDFFDQFDKDLRLIYRI